MSKHFGCKDCCKYQTDACDNPMYAEIGKHLCPMYVMDIEYCYEKGRAEAIDEYTEWLRKRHANFDEEYAEDIKSEYLEWLKEQKNG